MATELLERTAIQMFNDDSVVFQTPRDDLVRVSLPSDEAGMVNFDILDYENGLLSIYVRDFIRFPTEQETYAATMCSVLNTKSYGKFFIDKYRDVSYCLDLPTTETTGTSEFRTAFSVARSSFGQFYPVIMRVRWANATVEKALSEEEEEEEEPRPSTMSNEDIHNLRNDSGSQEVEPED